MFIEIECIYVIKLHILTLSQIATLSVTICDTRHKLRHFQSQIATLSQIATITNCYVTGLRVNMTKTKFLVSCDYHDVLQKSEKYPCAFCSNGVGRNAILGSQCMLWAHKTCSVITK